MSNVLDRWFEITAVRQFHSDAHAYCPISRRAWLRNCGIPLSY